MPDCETDLLQVARNQQHAEVRVPNTYNSISSTSLHPRVTPTSSMIFDPGKNTTVHASILLLLSICYE